MFVYIDESGHTGKNSKDPNQPIFHYMAIASTKNLDLDLDRLFRKILTENQILEIHGSKIFYKIESFASDLLKILRSNSVSCFYSIVEKDFLAYAKLYDILFDNVENKGARFQTYYDRTLRLNLLSIFMGVVSVEVAHKFYEECLFSKSEEKAIDVLKDVCNTILSRIHLVKDERAREIISDAVTWAMANPAELTTYHASKTERWTNLPQIASFLPLMNMLSNYSKKHKAPIMKITHDEQNQLKKVLTEIHQLAAGPETRATIDLGENGIIELSKIKNTTFEIKDSFKSFGLQTVDICLYVLTHDQEIEEEKIEWPKAYKLLEYIKAHTEHYVLTMEHHLLESDFLYNKVMNIPFTKKDLKRGEKTVKEWENQFKQNLNR